MDHAAASLPDGWFDGTVVRISSWTLSGRAFGTGRAQPTRPRSSGCGRRSETGPHSGSSHSSGVRVARSCATWVGAKRSMARARPTRVGVVPSKSRCSSGGTAPLSVSFSRRPDCKWSARSSVQLSDSIQDLPPGGGSSAIPLAKHVRSGRGQNVARKFIRSQRRLCLASELAGCVAAQVCHLLLRSGLGTTPNVAPPHHSRLAAGTGQKPMRTCTQGVRRHWGILVYQAFETLVISAQRAVGVPRFPGLRTAAFQETQRRAGSRSAMNASDLQKCFLDRTDGPVRRMYRHIRMAGANKRHRTCVVGGTPV